MFFKLMLNSCTGKKLQASDRHEVERKTESIYMYLHTYRHIMSRWWLQHISVSPILGYMIQLKHLLNVLKPPTTDMHHVNHVHGVCQILLKPKSKKNISRSCSNLSYPHKYTSENELLEPTVKSHLQLKSGQITYRWWFQFLFFSPLLGEDSQFE